MSAEETNSKAPKTSLVPVVSILSDVEDDVNEKQINYPTGMRLSFIVIALGLAVLCMALDNTILSTAVPVIASEFKSTQDLAWYGSAYLLTTCACQLHFGKLYTTFHPKSVYLSAILIFELGSLICGVAPSSACLIVGRAVAGIGASGIFSGSLLIINKSVPLYKRPLLISGLASIFGVACIFGSIMGGAITVSVGWRWCFYLNLPVGFVSIIFILFLLKLPEMDAECQHIDASLSLWQKLRSFDMAGIFFFFPSIVSLFLALQWGGTMYEWRNPRIIALFVVFSVFLVGFILVQVRLQEAATIPPRIFLNRTLWSCSLFAFFLGAAFLVMIYYLPVWFQAIKGANAVQSGLYDLPMVMAVILCSVIAGGVVAVTGYYTPLMIASSILMSIGGGLLSTIDINTSPVVRGVYQVIFGAGVGLGMQQTVLAVQASLDKADVSTGTAMIVFSQTLGGAVFLCVAQNLFENSLLSYLPDSQASTSGSKFLSHIDLSNVQADFHGKYLGMVLHFYNDAITQTFYLPTALAACSIIGAAFVPWNSVKGRRLSVVSHI